MIRLRTTVPLLVLTAAAFGAVPAVTAPAVAVPCQTAQRVEGAFRSVEKPDLLPGPLTAHAVEPADPRTVYLADPTRVVVSQDAGCSWKLLLEVPAAPSSSIRSLTVPDTAAPSGRLLVAVSAESLADGALASTTVLWSRLGAGLPFRQSSLLPGRVRPAVAPGDPDVVYAATNDVTVAGVAPPRSADGGAVFTVPPGLRTTAAGPSGPSVDNGPLTVAVDPGGADDLLVGSGALQRSTDGGSSWSILLDRPDVGQALGLAVHPDGGDAAGRAVLVATDAFNSGLDTDSARLWSVPRDGAPQALPLGPPLIGVPESVAVGRTAGEVAIVTASLREGLSDGYDGTGTLFLLDGPRGTWVDVADGRGHPLLGAQVDRTDDPAIHLHSSSLSEPPGADEYVVYSPPARGRVVPPTVDDGSGTGGDQTPTPALPPAPRACPDSRLFSPPELRRSASVLSPAQSQLTPDADGTARQDLRLDLAGDTVALDLDLLLDTSDSMGPAAAGIVCGLEELVTGLADDGIDVRLGLGEFWDAGPGQRYRRLVDLAPPDLALQRALRSIQTRGGDEPHRTALVQAAGGRGLTVDGVEVVAPGMGASFRPDALRVVLHITDEPWSVTTPDEPTPFEVIDVLNTQRVRHVGLQVLQDPLAPATGNDRAEGLADSALLRVQLDQFSSGTGALAPAAGVDCDGDGTVDLRDGDPLVCTGTVGDGVVPVAAPVRALLDAFDPRGPVVLRATAPAGTTAQVGRAYDDVALLSPTRLNFPLAITCGEASGPVEVQLQALAAGVPVADATSRVLCRPAPSRPEEDGGKTAVPGPVNGVVPAPVADGPAPAGVAPPPGGPPPVVQVPAPAPAPAGAAAGAAAAAAAGAAAPAGGAAGAVAAAPGAQGAAAAPGAQGAAAQGAAGLAGAPAREPAARARAYAGGGDPPLAAVPLGAGLLATAALTTHLLATRRRPSAPATVRTKDRS